jgi:large subunit ribosomal protein L10
VAKLQVVKNQLFRIAVEEAGIADVKADMGGQCAFISGDSDVSAAAKVIKNFASEFEKPEIKFGFLEKSRLEKQDVEAIADLPPLEVVRAQLLGTILSPATTLARLINTPGTQLAQVIKAKSEKGE